jgi:uncharacterized protein related to proFAR isomerase
MRRKYRAVLPIDVHNGHILKVRVEERNVQVRFLMTLQKGDIFYFNIDTIGNESSKAINNSNNKQVESSPGEVIFEATTEGPSTLRDYGTSVGLGLIIGVSIVFGFILGVLSVTEPLGPLQTQQQQ